MCKQDYSRRDSVTNGVPNYSHPSLLCPSQHFLFLSHTCGVQLTQRALEWGTLSVGLCDTVVTRVWAIQCISKKTALVLLLLTGVFHFLTEIWREQVKMGERAGPITNASEWVNKTNWNVDSSRLANALPSTFMKSVSNVVSKIWELENRICCWKLNSHSGALLLRSGACAPGSVIIHRLSGRNQFRPSQADVSLEVGCRVSRCHSGKTRLPLVHVNIVSARP